MISTTLYNDLHPHLIKADEVWIAVALMTEVALNKIQQTIPPTAHQHYLIGIDLPTSPLVFSRLKGLQSNKLEAAVLKETYTYHPKVYIIRKQSKLIAFVGSANATNGGFSNNYEVSIMVDNANQCQELLTWFGNLYLLGKDITDDFIEKYTSVYHKNRIWASTQRSNLNNLISSLVLNNIKTPINKNQFFKQSHYDAFDPAFHSAISKNATTERQKVRKKLLDLDDLIFPKFNAYGISNLHRTQSRLHLTSQWFFSARSSPIKEAIWLNYGKSHGELKTSDEHSFTNNIRIQVILRNNLTERYFGIWLFIGKPNHSFQDRKHLKKELENNDFLELIKTLLIQLGNSYCIKIGKKELEIKDISDKEDLRKFLLKDNFNEYYTIGRNYDPNSEEISELNIAETVLIEFSKLYKLYELIKTK